MTHRPGVMAPGLPLSAERIGSSNVETPLPTQRSAISAAERARREREIDFARGNVRHEGGILSDEIECLNARDLPQNLIATS